MKETHSRIGKLIRLKVKYTIEFIDINSYNTNVAKIEKCDTLINELLKQQNMKVTTVYPEKPPKDFNDWINYIFKLINSKK